MAAGGQVRMIVNSSSTVRARVIAPVEAQGASN
jgi:hypothetical protein